MNDSLVPTPPGVALRRFAARLWSDPDTRSTLIGLAGVLLIHLFLWLVAPRILQMDHEPMPAQTRPAPKQFNIEIAEDMFKKVPPQVKPPLPNKFVETNPDAPENTPDKTTNFSDRNQQVAQEKPTPDGKSDRPATEGRKDIENAQIVSGRLQQPVESLPPVPPAVTTPNEASAAAPRAEQNPLPGFDKKEGEDKNAFGSNIAKIPTNVRPIPERIEGAKDVPLIEGATAMQPAIDPKRPRPRPSVVRTQNVRPAILQQNDFGTKNMGLVGYDAKWSAYGEYLRRLIDTVQMQWERIIIDRKVLAPSGTFVVVKFVLNAEGKVARIVNVENHSTEAGAGACVSGITDRAPYGPWTDDMKAMLGEEQELTFAFHYQ
jgi:hypothetical protein